MPPFFGDATFFYTAMHRAAATRGAACAAPPAQRAACAAPPARSAPRLLRRAASRRAASRPAPPRTASPRP
jgi:hypothetical protein